LTWLTDNREHALDIGVGRTDMAADELIGSNKFFE
jgi:hypothetical protein